MICFGLLHADQTQKIYKIKSGKLRVWTWTDSWRSRNRIYCRGESIEEKEDEFEEGTFMNSESDCLGITEKIIFGLSGYWHASLTINYLKNFELCQDIVVQTTASIWLLVSLALWITNVKPKLIHSQDKAASLSTQSLAKSLKL